MRVVEVTVEHYKGLTGPITFSLTSGLNVIYGPNEIGKSTLADAIWAGLALPSRIGGQTLQNMVPRKGGTPYVQVRFERGGVGYLVSKVFGGNRQGSTTLRIEGDHTKELRDEDAEERLREVLGVGAANNRGTINEMGLWPLVWVKQGESVEPPTKPLNDQTRTTLSDRLGEIAGEVFAGLGAERLYEAVKERYLKYYTPRGSEAGGAGAPLRKVRDRHSEAEQAYQELRAQLDKYEDQLKRHARLQGDLVRLDEQLPRLRTAQAEADRAQEELAAVEASLEQAEAARKVAISEEERWARRMERRRELEQVVGEQGAQVLRLQAELSAREPGLIAHRESRVEQAEAVQRAEAEVVAGQRRVRRLRAGLIEAESGARLQEIEAELARIKDHQEALAQIVGELAALPVTEAALHRLRGLKVASHEADARLEAVSARLELHAIRPLQGSLGGEALVLEAGASQTFGVHEPTELQISDLVRVVLRPGGEDLAPRRERAAAAKRALDEALAELQLTDLDEGERAMVRRRERELEQGTLQGLLKSVNAEALQAARARAQTEQAEAKATLQSLPLLAGESPLPTDRSVLQAQVRQAEAAQGQAQEALRDTERALSTHDQREASLVAEVQGYRRQLEEARQAHARAVQAHQEHRADHGEDPVLAAEISARAEQVAAREAEVRRLTDARSALDPEQVRREQVATTRALQSATNERSEVKDGLARLEGELGGGQTLGLHDRVEKARAILEEAQELLDLELRRAQATKLLYDTLSVARSAARERHHAPLFDEVARLLRLLFPETEATVQLEEELNELTLDREGARGQDPFDALSGGAKEQLGVLVRLALARILAGEGSLPVLLDDALVSTDEERFQRMRRVLDAASEDLQIIFLTCHWERLRGLGLSPKHKVDLERVVSEA